MSVFHAKISLLALGVHADDVTPSSLDPFEFLPMIVPPMPPSILYFPMKVLQEDC
jgi:hypothetical protein